MEEFFAWAVTGGTGVNGLKEFGLLIDMYFPKKIIYFLSLIHTIVSLRMQTYFRLSLVSTVFFGGDKQQPEKGLFSQATP